jgi:hypothetical protein
MVDTPFSSRQGALIARPDDPVRKAVSGRPLASFLVTPWVGEEDRSQTTAGVKSRRGFRHSAFGLTDNDASPSRRGPPVRPGRKQGSYL